ncbi:hypothetical protein [Nicoliella lavandulae]|uniref:Uncharacterized protein n=1 Tax=Nicoliella lavandulae TaxID=3082954 RepID=A0ABU8SNA8_9LACO
MDVTDYILLFAVIVGATVTVWHEFNNYLVKQEAKKGAKYKALVDKSVYLNHIAASVVASVAVNPQITKSESMDAALSKFSALLNAKGISNISTSIARGYLESNYQTYKHNLGGDVHQSVTTLTDDAINAMLDGQTTKQAPVNQGGVDHV